jgi:small-conductance mechanosensitive channel
MLGVLVLGPLVLDLLTAGAILTIFLLLMLLVHLLWHRLLSPLISRTDTELDDIILGPTRTVVLWGLFLLGVYYSVGSIESIGEKAEIVGLMQKVLRVGWTLLAVWAAIRLLRSLAAWYVRKAAQHPEKPRDIGPQVTFVRRALTIVILVLGGLYVLRAAGVDITPLVASGAIGGLAVALALQDTLSNLFGGFFLSIDRPAKVGDFIRLESGEEGYVDEIGWRHTKVRLLANNVVVIPNSKLSQMVITNYYLPLQEMSVYVPCGVAYDSDLQRVEEVAIEVAKQVMQQVPGSSADWTPVVWWKEFGDSAITFVTVLRVKEFLAQYDLKSEFIKALHRRFNQEGIEIPFPIRTVIMKREA